MTWVGKARGRRADDLVTGEEVDMCHDHSACSKTFTECHTKSDGVAFDIHRLSLKANAREASALWIIFGKSLKLSLTLVH